MDFSSSLVITNGPNAGLPRPLADVMLDRSAAIKRALMVLKRNGFEPVRATLGAGGALNIKVLPNAATRRLIDDGAAAYWLDAHGYRKGQAWLDGVRIWWLEREVH